MEVFRDLGSRGVDILTVGQYLRPSRDHLPIALFYTPDEFRYLKDEALRFGFRHVESGPMVRSSYHAHEQAESTSREPATSQASFNSVSRFTLSLPEEWVSFPNDKDISSETSENLQADGQILFGILTDCFNQLLCFHQQFAGVVVDCRILEQLSYRALARIQPVA